MAAAGLGPVSILSVDDEQGLAELIATFLERENDRFTVEPKSSASEALDFYETHHVDAIISDFDMPEMDGLELLEAIRADDPDLPYVLFTGRGSEDIASQAISKGVTEYMQKGTGPDQYPVLANRVLNAVRRYRAERQANADRDRFRAVFEQASDAMILAADDGAIINVNSAAVNLIGRSKDELLGKTAAEFAVDDYDFTNAWDEFRVLDTERGLFPVQRPDGTVRVAEYAATANVLPGEHLSVLRDITEQREHDHRLEVEQERLSQFAGVLSHDLKNPVSVATGYVTLLQETSSAEDARLLQEVEAALDRIDDIIDDVLTISRSEGLTAEVREIDLSAVAESVWGRVRLPTTTASIEPGLRVLGDESLVERLLTNLLRNTIEHGGANVAVTIGALGDEAGFFVEDDGPGIPPDAREEVFNWHHSTKEGGTGIGLRSVKQIVDVHGWEITITEGSGGGARFEIVMETSETIY